MKPWDMNLEEWDRITQERVKEHFKPKPKPEKVINPQDLNFLRECAKQIRENSFRKIPLQTMTVQLSKLLRKRRDNQSRRHPTFHSSEPKRNSQ